MTMPNPQPTQMEQRMERSKDADVAWLMRWFGNGECCTQHTREHLGSIVARLTRPTADLGDDGEVIDWLGDVADPRCQHSLSREALTKVADRLILYRVALTGIVLAIRDGAATDVLAWQNLAEAMRHTARAALSQARQEGDK